jgi:cobalt-precorrin-5B (C1)-methyltransferase
MVEDYRVALSRFGGARAGRKGLSTGSCACAAAVAATRAMLAAEEGRGEVPGADASVVIKLPKSGKPWSELELAVPVASAGPAPDKDPAKPAYQAVVIKDSGDDTDITNGMPVVAIASRRRGSGVRVFGGRGVGRVTKPGLPVGVGQAAINPVPLRMIRESLAPYAIGRGIDLTIELPWGEELAVKTWNPRIGIVGGLSVIGTNGVVEPASSAAYRRSIYAALRSYRARGETEAWLGPGYVSERYFNGVGIAEDRRAIVGDHFGFALDAAARLGFERIHIAAHAGKLLKLAAGVFNTHARYGDARLETLAACAAAAGAPSELIRQLLDLPLAEEACAMLLRLGYTDAFDAAAARAAARCGARSGLPVDCVMVDLQGRALGRGGSAGGKSSGGKEAS